MPLPDNGRNIFHGEGPALTGISQQQSLGICPWFKQWLGADQFCRTDSLNDACAGDRGEGRFGNEKGKVALLRFGAGQSLWYRLGITPPSIPHRVKPLNQLIGDFERQYDFTRFGMAHYITSSWRPSYLQRQP